MLLGLLALTARLVLAAIIGVAGLAKLRDRAGTREGLQDFGVRAGLAGPGAVLLPIIEILVAAALLLPATAAAGAVSAVLLLATFSLAVAVNLGRGRAPRCRCFGNLGSAPTSWITVWRNVALMALGILSWAGGLPGAGPRGVAVLVAAALAATALAGLQSTRSTRGRERDREPGPPGAGLPADASILMLPPGAPAPAFSATDASTGRRVTRDDLLASRLPLLLVFTSRRCVSCKALLPDLAKWQRAHGARVTIAVASDGNASAARSEAREFALTPVLVDEDLALYHAFHGYGTPSAIALKPDATVGSYVAAGSEAVTDLFARVLRGGLDGEATLPLIPGMVVPSFGVPSLSGENPSVSPGAETVLLFWDPAADACRAMRRGLRRWESGRRPGGPRLVIVSSDDAEGARADGFLSVVLLDRGSRIRAAFGVDGAPAAVRVDADGRVASAVVAGAAEVLAMLGAVRRPIVDGPS
jgi:hypothetical protein